MTNGFDVDWILDLDILSFDSLIGSLHRIQCQEKVERSWLHHYAAQAKTDDFKKALKPLENGMHRGTDKPQPGTRGAQDFIARHGRGI